MIISSSKIEGNAARPPRHTMPQIHIFHRDNKRRSIPKGCAIVHFNRGSALQRQEFMRSILARNTDVIIMTDISCDEADAPCGCYGYDGACAWHRGSCDLDFAECLCSRTFDITCSYHKHNQ